MKGRLLLLTVILTILVSTPFYSGGVETVYLPSTTSTSPYNPYPFGTYSFYTDLAMKYDVEFISSPLDLEVSGYNIVYIVVGPDIPFRSEEAVYLKGLVEEGVVNILVFDETNISNSLVKVFDMEINSGLLEVVDVTEESRYISVVDCGLLGGGLVSKASIVSYESGNITPLCIGFGEYILDGVYISNPVLGAVKSFDSGSKLIVVSDSSICANFMYESTWWNERGNSELCLNIVDYLVDGDAKIVFDVGHYSGNIVVGPSIAEYLVGFFMVMQFIVSGLIDFFGIFLYPVILMISFGVVNASLELYKSYKERERDHTLDIMINSIIRRGSSLYPLGIFGLTRYRVVRGILLGRLLMKYKR